MLLLKGWFKRENIIFHEKNLKQKNNVEKIFCEKGTLPLHWVSSPGPFECQSNASNAFERQSGVEAFLFSQKITSIYIEKFHVVSNNVKYNSKSRIDKVDIVEFRYHDEWYTLLMIDIIDWNDLEKSEK